MLWSISLSVIEKYVKIFPPNIFQSTEARVMHTSPSSWSLQLGVTGLTQALWQRLLKCDNYSCFQNDQLAVYQVMCFSVSKATHVTSFLTITIGCVDESYFYCFLTWICSMKQIWYGNWGILKIYWVINPGKSSVLRNISWLDLRTWWKLKLLIICYRYIRIYFGLACTKNCCFYIN